MRRALTRTQELLLTSLWLGKLRPAPGTWGSLPPVVLTGVMMSAGLSPRGSSPVMALQAAVMLAVAIGFSAVCVWAGDGAETHFGKKDPGSVTADETAGMAITLLWLPVSVNGANGWWDAGVLLGAFLLFRVFDILKLFPAGRLQRVPGGWGILLDDLVAGVQAWVVLHVGAAILA